MSSVFFCFFFVFGVKWWYDKLLIFVVFVPVICARTHYLLHVININTLTITKLLNNSEIITVVKLPTKVCRKRLKLSQMYNFQSATDYTITLIW